MTQTEPQHDGRPLQAPDVPGALPGLSEVPGEAVQQALQTVRNWPSEAYLSKQDLAQSGFEHIGGLSAKCCSCGLVISDWRLGDSVTERHREESPDCPFVRAHPTTHSQAVQGPSNGGAKSSSCFLAFAKSIMEFQRSLRTSEMAELPKMGYQDKFLADMGGLEDVDGMGKKSSSCGPETSHGVFPHFVQRYPLSNGDLRCAPPLSSRCLHRRTCKVSVRSARSWFAEDVAKLTQGKGGLPTPHQARAEGNELFFQRPKATEQAPLNTFSDCHVDTLYPRALDRAEFCKYNEGDKGKKHGLGLGHHHRQEYRQNYFCYPILQEPKLAAKCLTGPRKVQPKAALVQLFCILGVKKVVGPKHPSQSSPDARMRSFDEWPQTSPKGPLELVKAGFFCIGMQDYTQCFHCGGVLCNWDASDDPWEEHARWFPRCQFVLLSKGEAFIEKCLRRHRLSSVVAWTCGAPFVDKKDTGTELTGLAQPERYYLREPVHAESQRAALVRQIPEQSQEFAGNEELLRVHRKLPALSRPSNGRTPVEQSSSSGTTMTPPSPPELPENIFGGEVSAAAKGEVSSPLPSDPAEVVLENRRLKERRLCKVCLDAEVGVVFLPCGHLVACSACASALSNCPVCRAAIAAAARAFLS
ncbi:death-associated inhibitor of apoptosis 2-like isoform X1 [Haemaphysalis longicornis]